MPTRRWLFTLIYFYHFDGNINLYLIYILCYKGGLCKKSGKDLYASSPALFGRPRELTLINQLSVTELNYERCIICL